MASAEERTIVLKAQNGDRFAFDQIYKLHNRRIQVIVSRRVRDPEDVKDLVQTVFIRAYEALPSFRGEAAYSTWLTRIALNVCNTHYQMQTSRRRMIDQAFLIYEALSILQEDPERITHRKQCHDLISTVPPNCRDVMWLRYVMRLLLFTDWQQTSITHGYCEDLALAGTRVVEDSHQRSAYVVGRCRSRVTKGISPVEDSWGEATDI